MLLQIRIYYTWVCCVLSLCFGQDLMAQAHPNLSLTPAGIAEIRAGDSAPLFESSVASASQEVEAWMTEGVQVPVPKDLAGGYTHEAHKRNFFLLQKAGALYQITQEERYAQFIRSVLLTYAELYPKLGKHPSERSYARGKLFWQCLNDANWLVYVSQAYDCVYDYLNKAERSQLETQLFRPFADYISIENPQFFNRIHNHSTWGNAAVGMIALVMGDEELLQRALYGIQDQKLNAEAEDNDGGLIQLPGQGKAGFLAQLDHAFSPDGYYTEGPYYQRYAMSPFILFAQALENHKPELKIFEYREGLLKKAVYAILLQTDSNGAFYPINDAQKGMSYHSRELVSAVDIIYYVGDQDPALLSVAQDQGRVQLDQSGFRVASDLGQGKAKPFLKKPVQLRDGSQGDEGAIAILRSGIGHAEISCLFKYAAQGMGHGHFDRLSYSIYDGSTEVLQDYASARWVNIDQKSGGGYLPENQSWAKQSLAHNTLVVDAQSHFNGKTKQANPFHGEPYYFQAQNPQVQWASAKEQNAYPGMELHRTLCLLTDKAFERPILIDLFRVQSDETHQLDLPFHFQTQLLSANFPYEIARSEMKPLGEGHGYQHAWQEAKGKAAEGEIRLTWFSDYTFYELTSLAQSEDELILARVGANDPHFNLRRDAFFMLRKKAAKDALFVSVVRPHGNYSPVTEIPLNPYPPKISLEVLEADRRYSIIKISLENGPAWLLMIANQAPDPGATHTRIIDGDSYSWTGPMDLNKLN